VKKGEKNSRNGCWLEGGSGSKKPKTRAQPSRAARDGHAPRVTVTRKSRWESQWLFFPYLANLNLFAHSQRPVLHYIKAISQEITYGKVLGGSVIEDFGPTTGDRPKILKPARRSKIESKLVL
jgi:hypothetical protein